MSGSICGGTMTWTKWINQKPKEIMGTMMCVVRKRIRYRGHYKYKIIDPLGDCWWWEEQKEAK
jgi:hypothetical protein